MGRKFKKLFSKNSDVFASVSAGRTTCSRLFEDVRLLGVTFPSAMQGVLFGWYWETTNT